jgi:general secretion pathway protein E
MSELQIHESGKVRTFQLPPRKVSIGRRADNDVVIEDKQVSRYHCTLEPTDGGYLLSDLGTRNGTRVNGERIERAVVTVHDEIGLGQVTLRIIEEQHATFAVLEELADSEAASQTEPIPMAILEDTDTGAAATPSENGPVNVGIELRNLATAGRDIGFDVSDITMLDRQGQPLHAAGARNDSQAVRLFRQMLLGAFRLRATDMHFEPRRTDYQIRFRVDGTMLPVLTLPEALGQSVLGVVKVLCELDISRRNVVQEGNFSVRVPGRHVDFRISYSPTVHGQKLVVRILDKTVAPTTLHELGLPATMLRALRSTCQMDSGMIIVSGPTGSGKTTTLYTALRSIDVKTRNIITIEDPVEYHLEGVTQTPVDVKAGLTFDKLLVSMLRQDPDVILVGEMRDSETARTGMQAAMTGHLVFTTLHARDTVGSIFRLMDLGVENYMISNAVTLCLSQRLVRVLCEDCKKPYRPSPSQLVKMKMENRKVDRLYTHVGCRKCMGVGFLGRQAIFEMLSFNEDLRDIILTSPTIAHIRKAADQWTFQTLLDSGYAKVAEGVTTIEEVDRVAVQE